MEDGHGQDRSVARSGQTGEKAGLQQTHARSLAEQQPTPTGPEPVSNATIFGGQGGRACCKNVRCMQVMVDR